MKGFCMGPDRGYGLRTQRAVHEKMPDPCMLRDFRT